MANTAHVTTILISRTDSIGDVVLTLPMAGVLKQLMPGARIVFLAKNYTREVVALCEHVDEFISYDEFEAMRPEVRYSLLRSKQIDAVVHVFPRAEVARACKKAGIALRIGTTNRLFHWPTCNKLIGLSRKNSPYHEAQLNLKLINCLGAKTHYELQEIIPFYGFTQVAALNPELEQLIDRNRLNIILHPKSKGSAREWGLENFSRLIGLLPVSRYKLFISGTREEGLLMQDFICKHPNVCDLTGKMDLRQFAAFINACDGLIAASTGPLHIAAALGKKALGLFSPKRPIHPGRWMPLGFHAGYLVFEEDCPKCKKGVSCNCIEQIPAKKVIDKLEQL